MLHHNRPQAQSELTRPEISAIFPPDKTSLSHLASCRQQSICQGGLTLNSRKTGVQRRTDRRLGMQHLTQQTSLTSPFIYLFFLTGYFLSNCQFQSFVLLVRSYATVMKIVCKCLRLVNRDAKC